MTFSIAISAPTGCGHYQCVFTEVGGQERTKTFVFEKNDLKFTATDFTDEVALFILRYIQRNQNLTTLAGFQAFLSGRTFTV